MDQRLKHAGGAVAVLAMLIACSLSSGCSSQTAIAPLINDLYSSDPAVQREAAMALVETGEPAVTPLIGVFPSENEGACTWAAVALCRIGEPAIQPLITALSAEENTTRLWAADTLACIGDPAIEPLVGTLASDDANAREVAAIALIKIGRPAIPELEEMALFGGVREKQIALTVIQSIYLTEKLQNRIQTSMENSSFDPSQ